jgi:hypothetical protein
MSPDLRPAFSVVSQISSAKSSDELKEILTSLHDKFGDRLNWEEFWRLMDQSDSKYVVLRDHKDLLLRLQGRDCSVPVFTAYVRFIANSKTGSEYIYEDGKRVCSSPLPAALTLQLIENAWVKSKRDPEIAAPLLQLFSSEASSTNNLEWQSAIDLEKESLFLEIFDSAIEKEFLYASAQFVHSFKQVRGSLPFPEYLSIRLLRAPGSLWNELSKSNSRQSIELLHEILSAPKESTDILVHSQPSTIKGISESLVDSPAGSSEDSWPTVWTRFQKTKEILLRLNQRRSLQERLDLISKAHRQLLVWMKAYTRYQAPSYLSQSLKYSPQNARNLDLAWVVLIASQEPQDLTEVRRRLRSLQSAGMAAEDQILLARLRLLLSVEEEGRSSFVEEYCGVMEKHGLGPVSWTASEFETQLSDGKPLSAGCHDVDFAGADAAMEFRQDLQGTLDTIVRLRNFKAVSLKAPRAFLTGIVLMDSPGGTLDLSFGNRWDKMVFLPGQPGAIHSHIEREFNLFDEYEVKSR